MTITIMITRIRGVLVGNALTAAPRLIQMTGMGEERMTFVLGVAWACLELTKTAVFQKLRVEIMDIEVGLV